jgi:hypothetical protein
MKPPPHDPLHRPSARDRAREAAAFRAFLLRHGETPATYRQIHRAQVSHKMRSKKP